MVMRDEYVIVLQSAVSGSSSKEGILRDDESTVFRQHHSGI